MKRKTPLPTSTHIVDKTTAGDPASVAHRKGLVARGEAQEGDAVLENGVTHRIVGYDADGVPITKRIRFSSI